MIDAIIELAFISSMVAWLHRVASGYFAVMYNGNMFYIAGKPLNLMVDQGHTSNGAAGTAFVLIGLGGIIALWLRSRPHFHRSRLSVAIYYLWVVSNVLALLLTLGALAYVFAVTNAHNDQSIDVALASTLNGKPYPLDTWTPQNWFDAVLDLDLAYDDVRADIATHYKVMRGWQYNLIPLFIIQLAETVLAVLDALARRKEPKQESNVVEKTLPS